MNTRNNSTGCCGSPAAASAAVTCGPGQMNPMSHWPARPRFFAGQLLTEDDLQSLSDYVVAKNRLHNRHLFGDGVVCGLEVTCHPCGGGTVIVQPGYALDCCGNDLLLPCPQPLDINAMVRELRIKMLGYDCGDPCKEEKSCCQEGQVGAVQKEGRELNEKKDCNCVEEPPRHYCLYLLYDEQLTDPVAPYSTDEPCGAQTCQATRIREGVRFELRCHEKDKPPIDLFSRICCCLGDLTSLQKSLSDGQLINAYSVQLEQAAAAAKLQERPKFDLKSLDELQQSTGVLKKMVAGLSKEKSEVSQQIYQQFHTEALNVGSLLSRYYLSDSRDPKWQKTAEDGAQSFKDAASFYRSRAPLPFENALENDKAEALFEVGGRVADSITRPSGELRVLESAVNAPVPVDIRFLVEKVPFTSLLLQRAVASLDALREWLLDRLDSSPQLTDCKLRHDVLTVILPASVANPGSSDVPALRAAAEPLFRYFWRYLVDCICSAINPVCPPCDDSGVLLACLEVKDCQVVRICNMERTFVLSPVALRYWLPPLHQVGETLEKVCCGCYGKEERNFPGSLAPIIEILSLVCKKEPRVYENLWRAVMSAMRTGSVSAEHTQLQGLVEDIARGKASHLFP